MCRNVTPSERSNVCACLLSVTSLSRRWRVMQECCKFYWYTVVSPAQLSHAYAILVRVRYDPFMVDTQARHNADIWNIFTCWNYVVTYTYSWVFVIVSASVCLSCLLASRFWMLCACADPEAGVGLTQWNSSSFTTVYLHRTLDASAWPSSVLALINTTACQFQSFVPSIGTCSVAVTHAKALECPKENSKTI